MNRAATRLAILVAVVATAALPRAALGHALDPAYLGLRAEADGRVDVKWKTANAATDSLAPELPRRCTPVSAPIATRSERSTTVEWSVDCGAAGLSGATIGVSGLRARQTDAVVRIALADGSVVQEVLRPDRPSFEVQAGSGVAQIALSYAVLGIEHIFGGTDHLLFVLGLVLLASGGRQLLWTITSFTVGHSVTLSLATLGVIHVPQAPIEALIAASIVLVALELAREIGRPGAPGRTPGVLGRSPWAVALAFGLLHGLGFAGALAQVGLPAGEIPLALLSFNVGIEAGQLMFIAAVLAARAAFAAIGVRWPEAARLVPAYGIGALASYWVIERVALVAGGA